MTIYRVGEGQSTSGKVLDPVTEWYQDYTTAVARAKVLKKKLYMRKGNSKYTDIQ